MAISILKTPDAYSPARQPTCFLLNSDQTSKAGFGYFAHLFIDDELIGRFEIPKRPVNGLGVFDVSSVVRSYIDVETDLVPGYGGATVAPSFAKQYVVQFGEQLEYFSFDDSYYGPSGRVLFSSSTDQHDFEVGDSVLISQTPPFLFSEWEGQQTVMDVPDAYSFTIDQGFQSGPTTPGKVRKADGSSLLFSGLTGWTGTSVAYSFDREEFVEFDSVDYVPSSSTAMSGLICNAPQGFRVSSTAQAFIPQLNDNLCDWVRVVTLDANGSVLGVYGYQFGASVLVNDASFVYCGVGPVNLAASTYFTWTGSTSMFGSDVASYRIDFIGASTANNDATVATRSLLFELDDRCAPYDRFDLLFCDKRGAWMPWSFVYKSDEKHTVKKQVYGRAEFGEISGSDYIFRNRKRGVDVYNLDHIVSYTVRTDWMTEEESVYFVELVSASNCFWMKDDDVYIPIIINDGTTERLKRFQEPDLLRYELTFSKAYKENSLT